jgi:plasmid maintenance system antidote protein VapI
MGTLRNPPPVEILSKEVSMELGMSQNAIANKLLTRSATQILMVFARMANNQERPVNGS